MSAPREARAPLVGPVLRRGDRADAIVAAIRAMNRDVSIQDRGAYVRVLVPRRCVITREALEQETGASFALPQDLELVMPSFCGRISISEREVVWDAEPEP